MLRDLLQQKNLVRDKFNKGAFDLYEEDYNKSVLFIDTKIVPPSLLLYKDEILVLKTNSKKRFYTYGHIHFLEFLAEKFDLYFYKKPLEEYYEPTDFDAILLDNQKNYGLIINFRSPFFFKIPEIGSILGLTSVKRKAFLIRDGGEEEIDLFDEVVKKIPRKSRITLNDFFVRIKNLVESDKIEIYLIYGYDNDNPDLSLYLI